MLRRVRRAMALTTVNVAVACLPAGSARADLDPVDGTATTSTTVDPTPTTVPSSDSTTTTTTAPTDRSTITTTAPAPSPAGAVVTNDIAEVPGFDASGLGGLLGVGANTTPVPAGVTSELALADSESALPSRDHDSPSWAALLGLSLPILLALVGGAAYRWWDRGPDRYWPA